MVDEVWDVFLSVSPVTAKLHSWSEVRYLHIAWRISVKQYCRYQYAWPCVLTRLLTVRNAPPIVIYSWCSSAPLRFFHDSSFVTVYHSCKLRIIMHCKKVIPAIWESLCVTIVIWVKNCRRVSSSALAWMHYTVDKFTHSLHEYYYGVINLTSF